MLQHEKTPRNDDVATLKNNNVETTTNNNVAKAIFKKRIQPSKS